MRVVAFDYRGTGDSPVQRGRPPFAYGRDLAAAVAQLRADGAKKVAVVGASFGGAVAMTYASGVEGWSASPARPLCPSTTSTRSTAVSHLNVPLLIIGSRSDTYLPVAGARELLRRAGSTAKSLVLYPGSWHGWQIVEDAPVRAQSEGRGARVAPHEDRLEQLAQSAGRCLLSRGRVDPTRFTSGSSCPPAPELD